MQYSQKNFMRIIGNDQKNNGQNFWEILERIIGKISSIIGAALQNSPSQIYNVYETGIPLDPKAPKILVPKGIKKPRYQSPGQKGQITEVACGNAAGNVLPPLIIFDTKKVQPAWTKDEVSGSK